MSEHGIRDMIEDYKLHNDEVKNLRNKIEHYLRVKDRLNSQLSRQLVHRDSVIMQNEVFRDIIKRKKLILRTFKSYPFRIVIDGVTQLSLELDDYEITHENDKLVSFDCKGDLVSPNLAKKFKQEFIRICSIGDFANYFDVNLDKERTKLNKIWYKLNSKCSNPENYKIAELQTQVKFRLAVNCHVSFPKLLDSFIDPDTCKLEPYYDIFGKNIIRVDSIKITPKNVFNHKWTLEYCQECLFDGVDIYSLIFNNSQFGKDFKKEIKELYNKIKAASVLFDLELSEMFSLVEDCSLS